MTMHVIHPTFLPLELSYLQRLPFQTSAARPTFKTFHLESSKPNEGWSDICCSSGSCGTIGSAVASDTGDQRFESRHRQ